MKKNKVIIIFFMVLFYCDIAWTMVGRVSRIKKIPKAPSAVISIPSRGPGVGPAPAIPLLPTVPSGAEPFIQVPSEVTELQAGFQPSITQPFKKEIQFVEIKKQINPKFFNNIIEANEQDTALGFISEKAAQDLIAHEPAYKELFQSETNIIENKEGKTLFKSEHNNMGYSIQFKKSDAIPTLYTIFGAEKSHTDFLNDQFPTNAKISIKKTSLAFITDVDTLFKSVLENTTTKQIEQQKAENAMELAQKKALVEKLKATELKAKQALEQSQKEEQNKQQELQQAQQIEKALKTTALEKGEAVTELEKRALEKAEAVIELETKIPTLKADLESARQKEMELAEKEVELTTQIEKESANIAEIEQKERDRIELNEFEKEINAELDLQLQKELESLKEKFQKKEIKRQNRINEYDQNLERIEQNLHILDKNIETLEQEQQQALQEQAQAKTERELQQAQQKEQDILTEKQQIEKEQAGLQKLHDQHSKNKERLKQQESNNQETYRQELEALEKKQQEFNEEQRLEAQERAQQQELAARERTERYTAEEESIIAEESAQKEILKQETAQRIAEREATQQQKEFYETEKMQIEEDLKNINEQIGQQVQKIAQRKAQHLAEIEARTTQELQAFETEQLELSEQEKQKLAEQKRAEETTRTQQELQEQTEIKAMELELNTILQHRKNIIESQINVERDAQNTIQSQLQQTKQELSEIEQMVTMTGAEKNELIETIEKNRQSLQQEIKNITSDLAKAQEELKAAQQEELRIERMIKEEKPEEGGEATITQPTEIQKPTEIPSAERALIRTENISVMPSTLMPETIENLPIPSVELPEKPQVQQVQPTVAAAPSTVTLPTPAYTPSQLPLYKRNGVPRTTTPPAKPAYLPPSSITTIVEPFKPWKHEGLKEEPPRAGFTYQPPYIPHYEGPYGYPTEKRYIEGGRVEEIPEIQYPTVAEVRKTPSRLQSKLALQIPAQPEEVPMIVEEEQPVKEIQEWKPLPKKIWPTKPPIEKEVPEAPQVNWFWKLVMRIVEYINKFFGK